VVKGGYKYPTKRSLSFLFLLFLIGICRDYVIIYLYIIVGYRLSSYMLLLSPNAIKIKASPIQGRGIFANVNIPKHTVIWKFNPIVDHVIKHKTKKHTKHYWRFDNFAYYSQKHRGWVYCTDRMKWMNHSSVPNTTSAQTEEDYVTTTREIKKGEELTENYCVEYPTEYAC
jgi:SET domain-containing protein